MKTQDVKKTKLPDTPGVYFFRGKGREILYIGKATSLRDRVRSYFNADIIAARGPQIAAMLQEARRVTFKRTDSVLEALILEAALIKKHHPKYNVKEKDDKSFNYVVITHEGFPRVLVVRGKELFRDSSLPGAPDYERAVIFGPFPSGAVLRDAMKIVRKIFPFRDACAPGQGKACFSRQIGLCPGVCTGEISAREYGKTIRNLKLFFSGKKKTLIAALLRDMRTEAKNLAFEKAGRIKRTINSLEHIRDVALIKEDRARTDERGWRIEGYDVAHIGGAATVGVMAVIDLGAAQKSEYRKFKIRSVKGAHDTRSLSEVLERRFSHSEWPYPRLIVVDGGKAQKNAAERVLAGLEVRIPVVAVTKDEHHRPREILGDRALIAPRERDILLVNVEAHRFAVAYHKKVRGKMI